jgi:CBS domain-containing protein
MAVSTLLRAKPANVITIPENEDLGQAARLLMKHNIGGLPVVSSSGSPVGFLSERDIVRAMEKHPRGLRGVAVREAMRRPAPTCGPDDRLPDVMGRMTRDRLRHLVVMGDDGILGVISVGDLVKHRLEQLETETGVLRDYVAAQRARG